MRQWVAQRRALEGLGFALLLGLILLALSYLRLAALLKTDAFHSTRVVAETLTEPLWRTRLGLNVALFAAAQVGVHLAFGGMCWLLALAGERAWPRANLTRRKWIAVWFLVGTIWLLLVNASLFPRSSLGAPYKAVGQIEVARIRLHVLMGALAALGAASTMIVALRRTPGRQRTALITSIGAVLAVAASTSWLAHVARPSAPSSRPNFIVLGIDSLRPDFVDDVDTPNVREFLRHSTQFTNAITPLARTFPSWVSILTGRHPHTTGAFMNLLPRELIHEGATLPAQLRHAGYRAIYGIDETRFSNLDSTYGFDEALAPPMGGSDFVLTWFSDTPLSNLIINTRFGRLLFPYQYANRAAFVTYDPDSFVARVTASLGTRQPVFLAIHLTLPHWPFEWRDSDLPKGDDTATQESILRWKYRNSVRRADQQFGALLANMESRGLLANAVVVALSDHGEAFGTDDGFMQGALPGEEDSVIAAQAKGHGTSVFSPPQYHTLLGVRAYGAAAASLRSPGFEAASVSLLDITPTVLEMAGIPPAGPVDGQSLLPLLRQHPAAPQAFDSRIRFTESEYNPGGFDTSNMTASALAAAAMVYRVDPRTDQLRVRPELIPILLNTRQYAALLGDSFGAAVPRPTGGGPYRFIYRPGSGRGTVQEQALLKSALESRFGIQFGGEAIEIRPTR